MTRNIKKNLQIIHFLDLSSESNIKADHDCTINFSFCPKNANLWGLDISEKSPKIVPQIK